jgi:hypothetical protein
LLQFELLGDVSSDYNAILTTTSAGKLMLLEWMVLTVNGQKIREYELASWFPPRLRRRLGYYVFVLLRFERQRLEEQLLIWTGHVALPTRSKHCLLEERQLLVSIFEGRLQGRNLLLLDSD